MESSEYDWKDVVCNYSADVDILKVYFIRVTQGTIANSNNITDNVIADYDKDGLLVALEFMDASHILPCHFNDTQEDIDGKSPLLFVCDYSPDVDCFVIKFTDETGKVLSSDNVTDNIIFDYDKLGRITSVEFLDASCIIRKYNVAK